MLDLQLTLQDSREDRRPSHSALSKIRSSCLRLRQSHFIRLPDLVLMRTKTRQTDDTLPFRNNLLGEYALLMAAPPLGLGLSEPEVTRIAEMGMQSRFKLLSLPN